ncbi:MAG: tetratricopeptide repeat protein [Chloroflexi bacterium]|nr:tetratricopeptide repeat protein [Chloroflexota bacterium]
MLNKLFEDSDRPPPEVLKETALVLFEEYCNEFKRNPSPKLCLKFIKEMPKIAAHKELVQPLAEVLFEWRDTYMGFGMIAEWDYLVKSVSFRIFRDLGFEKGWELVSQLSLSRVLTASVFGDLNGIENAYEMAMEFGLPERDLFANIERISAYINYYGYAKLKPLHEEARGYFEATMAQPDPRLQLRALVMMSRLESSLGKHAIAFELAQQGIILAQEHNQISLAVSLFPVMILPYLQSNTRTPYLNDVFTYWDQNIPEDNLFGRALFSGNYGVFLLKQKEYPAAIQYLRSACIFYEVVGWEQNLGRTLLSLGAACGYTGDYDSAVDAFEQALEIYERLDISDHIAMAFNNLGWVHGKMGNSNQAIEYLELAWSELKGLPESSWKTSLLNKITDDLEKLQ